MADMGGVAVGTKSTPVKTIYSATFGQMPIGTYYTPWQDLRQAKRAAFLVTNYFDQPVTVQLIGQFQSITLPPSASGVVPILDAQLVSAVDILNNPGVLSVGISDVYWHPYAGLQMTVDANPTQGLLTVQEIIQG
jgi:hypothetical protein